MNKYTKELVKPGDTFIHLASGAIYRLLRTEQLARKFGETGPAQIVYVFQDLSTDQQVDYTWGMFRDRLKYAPEAAQILYSDKDAPTDR